MHKAIVAKINNTEEIPGANTIQVGYVLGEAVIISKDIPAGFVGIYFPEGLQLSHDYCHFNNLYRHSEYNSNKNQQGFFEDNRRVKAQKFMKVKSEGYFAPLSSLSFTGYDISKLKEGDKIDELNKITLCQKWIKPHTVNTIKANTRKGTKVETPLFHQHVDTEQLAYYIEKIPSGATISFHHKLHGTSARYTHTLVKRPLVGLKSKMNNYLDYLNLPKFKLKERESWEHIAGTRRVVLYEGQRDKEGFNGPERWRFEWLDKLIPYLEKGVTVYGEIVGYANGSPIMGKHSTAALKDKDFTKKYGKEFVYKYCCTEGENRFIVYRVTYTTPEGREIDLSLDQMKHWCYTRGFEHTREVAPRRIYDGDSNALLDMVKRLAERPEALCEDYEDPSHINEGIVVRVDYQSEIPKFYKLKSVPFKIMEGIYKEDNVDLEDAS